MTDVRQNPTNLAIYACNPEKTRGRLFDEPDSITRNSFQRDRDRIIHSAAFRRLEYKTQVFVNHEGDHYRTRLTHTLEVSQIARTIARCLNLNEDLSEALSLAHDLGHPPFGHAGESALSELMREYGGFDHNAHTFSVVSRLERRYPDFDGLNLTWETLEGIVKHNGPMILSDKNGTAAREIYEFDRKLNLQLDSYAGAEAQVAALADDIAYNNHDIDDGIRAGLFAMSDLVDIPGIGEIIKTVKTDFPETDETRQRHEIIRNLIGMMVSDCLTESRLRLEKACPTSVDDIRLLDHPIVSFSESIHKLDRCLKDFLYEKMYRHFRVNRMTSKARRVIAGLFQQLLSEPENLPTKWQEKISGESETQKAQVIADYIAGMTDRFAYGEYSRIVDLNL
jgi:dGTPase